MNQPTLKYKPRNIKHPTHTQLPQKFKLALVLMLAILLSLNGTISPVGTPCVEAAANIFTVNIIDQDDGFNVTDCQIMLQSSPKSTAKDAKRKWSDVYLFKSATKPLRYQYTGNYENNDFRLITLKLPRGYIAVNPELYLTGKDINFDVKKDIESIQKYISTCKFNLRIHTIPPRPNTSMYILTIPRNEDNLNERNLCNLKAYFFKETFYVSNNPFAPRSFNPIPYDMTAGSWETDKYDSNYSTNDKIKVNYRNSDPQSCSAKIVNFDNDFGNLFAPYRQNHDLLLMNYITTVNNVYAQPDGLFITQDSSYDYTLTLEDWADVPGIEYKMPTDSSFIKTYMPQRTVTNLKGEATFSNLPFDKWYRLGMVMNSSDRRKLSSNANDLSSDPHFIIRGPRYINSNRTSFTYDVYHVDDIKNEELTNSIIAQDFKTLYADYFSEGYQPRIEDETEIKTALSELKEKESPELEAAKTKLKEYLQIIEKQKADSELEASLQAVDQLIAKALSKQTPDAIEKAKAAILELPSEELQTQKLKELTDGLGKLAQAKAQAEAEAKNKDKQEKQGAIDPKVDTDSQNSALKLSESFKAKYNPLLTKSVDNLTVADQAILDEVIKVFNELPLEVRKLLQPEREKLLTYQTKMQSLLKAKAAAEQAAKDASAKAAAAEQAAKDASAKAAAEQAAKDASAKAAAEQAAKDASAKAQMLQDLKAKAEAAKLKTTDPQTAPQNLDDFKTKYAALLAKDSQELTITDYPEVLAMLSDYRNLPKKEQAKSSDLKVKLQAMQAKIKTLIKAEEFRANYHDLFHEPLLDIIKSNPSIIAKALKELESLPDNVQKELQEEHDKLLQMRELINEIKKKFNIQESGGLHTAPLQNQISTAELLNYLDSLRTRNNDYEKYAKILQEPEPLDREEDTRDSVPNTAASQQATASFFPKTSAPKLKCKFFRYDQKQTLALHYQKPAQSVLILADQIHIIIRQMATAKQVNSQSNEIDTKVTSNLATSKKVTQIGSFKLTIKGLTHTRMPISQV